MAEPKPQPMTCKICGCTTDSPCRDGCFWFERNLCSKCVRADERAKTLKEVKGKLYYMVDRQNAKCFFEWLEAELGKLK